MADEEALALLAWQVAAGAVEQPDGKRDVHRLLLRLARRRPQALPHREREALARRVVTAFDLEVRRAGLRVPQAELREVDARRIFHRIRKVVAGDGLAVMALEVEIDALAVTLRSQQRVHHPHHLGALLVDGRGVEIVDLDVGVRPHGMGHRPGVLRELAGAQSADIVDARIGGRAHVGRELLVAKDRQPFLERELEPVAAGDPVAGPVMEVFVGDDGLDRMIVEIRRRLRIGQDELRVEDVQPLVLHRAHVEVVDGDDHERVEVVFEAVDILVPLHRFPQ